MTFTTRLPFRTALIFCITFALVSAVFVTNVAGPFDVLAKEARDCDNPEQYPIKLFGNKIRKFNRTMHVYSASATVPTNLTDEFQLVANLAVKGNGGWKNNFFVTNLGGVCKALHTYGAQIWKEISRQIKSDCPLPAGNYSVRNLPMNVVFNWPSLPYNTYIITFEISRPNRKWFCKSFLIDVVPKGRH